MKTRIQKWGNSMALRIPKPFAREANLKENALVDVALEEGKIVVSAVARSKPTIQRLLAGVSSRNLHRAIDTGSPRGVESW